MMRSSGRECHCGDTLSYESIVAPLSGRSFPCGGASQDLCGAALRLNLYTLRSTLTSKTSSTTKSTSMSLIQPSSSVHSSSSSSSKYAVSTSTSGRISSTTLLTSSRRTTSSAKTSTSSLPVHTLGWSHIGCFLEVDARGDFSDQDMTILLKTHKMNPALCISAASSRKTAVPVTNYHYVGLEHGRDCYAATVASAPIPTSLVERKLARMPVWEILWVAPLKCVGAGSSMINMPVYQGVCSLDLCRHQFRCGTHGILFRFKLNL
ncbi:uncharacterized protein K444DRAFT_177730 [Hyaloscypha bicolor E]|uniref:Uncharacterized protein n=1 Tax=Hyaloscypha bicolor E TaxID=1095630 RepID=A0A2J6TQP0_9HELO|nr:uncharacterized protein K444DRAFT_177730 [Hyaloscypha bicolor E]PMD65341.1 hypothetical protein K444DRAFT_177730 [Hyaloscypha bicolor E]